MNYGNSRTRGDPLGDRPCAVTNVLTEVACLGCPPETAWLPGILFYPGAPSLCTSCGPEPGTTITKGELLYEKMGIEGAVGAGYLPPAAAALEWCEMTTAATWPTATATAKAGGDPHMTNAAGKNFDVQDEGDFTLLTYPVSAHSPLLNIAGQIERYASSCHSTFIKQLMLSGQWVVPMNVSVEKVISKKPKLLVTRDGSFEKMPQEEPLITTSKQEQEMNIDIKSQNITIHIDATNCRRKQWCDEGKWVHLNLDVQGLSRLESNELGGILGNDPYVSSTECTTRNLLQTDDTSLGPLSYATVTA